MAATLFYDVLSSSPEYAGGGGEVPIHHGEIYIFNTPKDTLALEIFSGLTKNSLWCFLLPVILYRALKMGRKLDRLYWPPAMI